MSYKVRQAVRDDVEAMIHMQLTMAWETEELKLDEDTLRRGMTLPFERPGVADYYVVEEVESRQVVAMLMTTQEWSDWRAGSIMWVQSVYVTPDHRRRGLFRLMYEHLRKLVETSDYYQGIRLYVETENANAMATYRSMGMEVEHYHMMKWMKGSF
ncbi:Acetyltransferase (GNAT) family [Novymonas esmeraldas]|uniref:Acetyltransferase (GNAT) family n=1 Tax=Novymonas esmeraldas TaxID=1808958 RepID=A0AAW0EWI5_9TRYP